MSRFVARLPDGDLDGRHALRYAFVLWDALSVAASASAPVLSEQPYLVVRPR